MAKRRVDETGGADERLSGHTSLVSARGWMFKPST
jgi:hypothetical protein